MMTYPIPVRGSREGGVPVAEGDRTLVPAAASLSGRFPECGIAAAPASSPKDLMKHDHFWLILALSTLCSFSLSAQKRKELPPSFATVTKREPLWIVQIKQTTFTIEKEQIDSLIRLGQVEDLKLETGPKVAAIYGSRGLNGVAVVQLRPSLSRKQLRKLSKELRRL